MTTKKEYFDPGLCFDSPERRKELFYFLPRVRRGKIRLEKYLVEYEKSCGEAPRTKYNKSNEEARILDSLINAPCEDVQERENSGGWVQQQSFEKKLRTYLFDWDFIPVGSYKLEAWAAPKELKERLEKAFKPQKRKLRLENAKVDKNEDEETIIISSKDSVKFTRNKEEDVVLLEINGRKYPPLPAKGSKIYKNYNQASLPSLLEGSQLRNLIEKKNNVAVANYVLGASRDAMGTVVRISRGEGESKTEKLESRIKALRKIFDCSDDLYRHFSLVRSPYFYSTVPSLVEYFSGSVNMTENDKITLAFYLSSGRPRLISGDVITFDNPGGVLDYVLDEDRYMPAAGIPFVKFLDAVKNDPCVLHLDFIWQTVFHADNCKQSRLSEDVEKTDTLLRLKQAATVIRTAEKLGAACPSISRFNGEWSASDEHSPYFLPGIYKEVLLSLISLEGEIKVREHRWVEEYPGGIYDLCSDLLKMREVVEEMLLGEISKWIGANGMDDKSVVEKIKEKVQKKDVRYNQSRSFNIYRELMVFRANEKLDEICKNHSINILP